ncbi:MAG: class I adenylate-forming enzyme family protein, partial [Pseudomonadota bacterium]|nr:class I adenylate-forming enzyme family protein [Pseudomonadota bacterium]
MRDIEATPFPSHAVQLVDYCARQHADRPFLNFFDDQDVLSYGDVSHLTRRLANGLSSRGISQGTHVAVMVDTSRTYPLTWLALSRLGAVTIPVNYRYTPREVDFVLRDSQATHLVICSDFLTVLDGISNGAPLSRDNIIVAGNEVTGYVNWQNLFDKNETGRSDQS